MKDIVFLGIQWCGKGTQAKLLLQDLPDHRYFEMGQTLRALMSSDNMIGNYIRDIVNWGEMIDNFITHDLIHTWLKIAEKNKKHFIVDWFPRLPEQAEYFSKRMEDMKREFVIIHLALSKEQALDRMIKRATIEWRKDDSPEAMEQRIDIFIHQTLRVIKHFEKLWKVITIDANGSIESIQEQLKYQLWL